MIFIHTQNTDREGALLTSLQPMTNRERLAKWYTKRAGWDKYLRPEKAAERLLQAASLAGNAVGCALVIGGSYYLPVIVGGLCGVASW